MFKQQTLFVVGAGASSEVGLPVGGNLASLVADRLDVRFDDWGQRQVSGDPDIFNHFRRDPDIRKYQEACWQIRDGVRLSRSIDDFLDLHNDNSFVNKVGKTAIAKTILEAERDSKLYFNENSAEPEMDLSAIQDTWFVKFIQTLSPGVARANSDKIFNSVSFLVFNYDRCIEHFLVHSLIRLYGIPAGDAGRILGSLNIIHPYGKVGELRTIHTPGGVQFGGKANYAELAKQIRTYSEQIEDGDELESIRKLLSDAKAIVFLGFAFHDQNLRIMNSPNGLGVKSIFGTAYKMSNSDVDVVRDQLRSFFTDKAKARLTRDAITLQNDLTCSGLFDYYTKTFRA